ncbi:hypothetical protein FLE29_22775 [Salmonella enterica]|nr:hypothetical protein [Salmonella enterica]
MYVYPGFFLPVRAQASAKRIVSLFLLINKLMLISSFVYAYSLKKRDAMTLTIAFLDAVN